WYADNFAARFEYGARTVRRNVRVVQPLGHIDEMRTQFGDIARQPDLHGLGLARFQIVEMECAKLLVYDGARARRRGFEIEPMILDELLHLFGTIVIAEKRDRAAAVREEVNLVAN